MSEIIIDPRDSRKDWGYMIRLLLFWLLWTALTVVVTVLASVSKDWFPRVWLTIGYTGVLAIPISLILSQSRCQKITITEKEISLRPALPWIKIVISREDLKAVTLERYEDGEIESIHTLNIFRKSERFPRRITLAGLVSIQEKSHIYERLVAELSNYGYAFEVRNTFSPN